MNIKNPLAAALLMTASVAMAQVNPSGNSGFCLTADLSCQSAYMKDLTTSAAGVSVVETTTAYTGLPPDREWASPTCQYVPCKLKEAEPVKPAWDQAALEKEMAAEKGRSPGAKILDLGNGTFAVDSGDGTVTINTANSCGAPLPMTPEMKEKFAAQDAKDAKSKAQKDEQDTLTKNSAKMWGGADKGAGDKKSEAAVSATDTNSHKGAGNNPADSAPGNGARELGAAAFDDSEALADNSGSTGKGSGASHGGGLGLTSGDQGRKAEISSEVVEVNDSFTWHKNAETLRYGKDLGKNFEAAITEEAGANRRNVDSTLGPGATPAGIQAAQNDESR